MEKTNILYGIVGLLGGLLIAGSFIFVNNKQSYEEGAHRMSDGSMMSDSGMDMGDTMKGMMSGLEGKTGDAFDKGFLSEMIVHHQGAVEMAQAVLKTSERAELVKLAKDIISAQTGEITMMQSWQKAWFK